MKKLLLFLCCFQPLLLWAQGQGSFVHFDLGGGLQTLLFEPQDARRSMGAGVTLDVSYRYFFNKTAGIRLGLGLSTARSKAVINCTDVDVAYTEAYDRRVYYTDWTEKESVFALEVPVGICLQRPVSRTLSFAWDAGAALYVPINNDFEISTGTLETRAYYPTTHQEVAEDESLGMRVYTTDKAAHRLPFGSVGLSLFTDLGFHYSKRGSLPFYFGLYVSGGVLSIVKANDQHLFAKYYNGLFASEKVSRVHPLSVGVKIGFSLDCDRQCRGGRCGFN
ncbi:MAG: hypothetical protein J6Y77_04625 [Paludibacteraceae bacterium]|nr:hypothetical protein [Paludibacteraceae bacterium]